MFDGKDDGSFVKGWNELGVEDGIFGGSSGYVRGFVVYFGGGRFEFMVSVVMGLLFIWIS